MLVLIGATLQGQVQAQHSAFVSPTAVSTDSESFILADTSSLQLLLDSTESIEYDIISVPRIGTNQSHGNAEQVAIRILMPHGLA